MRCSPLPAIPALGLRTIVRTMRNQRGVTLIELIIAAAIMGLLAFTLTPRVLAKLNEAKLNTVISAANELSRILEYDFISREPQQYVAAGAPDGAEGGTTDWAVFRDAMVERMSMSPYTGLNVVAFAYHVTADRSSYCLSFQAKDRNGTYVRVTPAGLQSGTDVALACPSGVAVVVAPGEGGETGGETAGETGGDDNTAGKSGKTPPGLGKKP